MNFDAEINKYLKGEVFSNSLVINLDRKKYEDIPRETLITGMIKGTRVIHLGCSDHIDIIPDKIAANKWLHKLLTDNSAACLGIDIDHKSIEFLKEKLGYSNVRQGDVVSDSFPEIESGSWDYVVFGELIEHLDNPVDFLKSFRTRFSGNVNKFIITVPSIYNRDQTRNIFRYKEVINSDHRFWFTPYTISKLVVSAGYRPEKMIFAGLQHLNTAELALRKIKRLFGMKETYPFYRFNNIIITGYLK
jgi:hypothetical protein